MYYAKFVRIVRRTFKNNEVPMQRQHFQNRYNLKVIVETLLINSSIWKTVSQFKPLLFQSKPAQY